MLPETDGLEPLASLPPPLHARRVMAMFKVIPPVCPVFGFRSGYVYFARLASGPIKIGTSCNPKARIANLRSGLPEPITLIGYLEGSFEREAYLHGVYADERIRGEFFAPSPRVEAFIAHLNQTAECVA